MDNNKDEIIELKSEITNKEKEINTFYKNYITKAERTTATKKLCKAPVFKERIAKHNVAKKIIYSTKTQLS